MENLDLFIDSINEVLGIVLIPRKSQVATKYPAIKQCTLEIYQIGSGKKCIAKHQNNYNICNIEDEKKAWDTIIKDIIVQLLKYFNINETV